MQYRELVKNAPLVSALGFGCLRFITKNGKIDEVTADRQMLYAYEQGVNYFDTAYIYNGGASEVILGNFIKKHNIRDKVFIADKLPLYLVLKSAHLEKYFKVQLQRLSTDYIDYYLLHMLDSLEIWNRLKKLGILEFIAEKKRKGQIKYIGFSFHGRSEEFAKIIDDYEWDFCQIQYNYLDENHQAGKAGLQHAYKKGVGISVMEPLRGGNLAAKAPEKVLKEFAKFPEKRSAAHWALRWVLNHEEVAIALSGMNDMAHIKENIAVANDAAVNCMTPQELSVIDNVKEIYKQLTKVPCTACNYCMPCPFGVDIPATFTDYNSKYFFDNYVTWQYVYRAAGGTNGIKAGANSCTNCKKCMSHCPQHIEIPAKLKQAHKELSNPIMLWAMSLYFKILRRKKKEKNYE